MLEGCSVEALYEELLVDFADVFFPVFDTKSHHSTVDVIE